MQTDKKLHELPGTTIAFQSVNRGVNCDLETRTYYVLDGSELWVGKAADMPANLPAHLRMAVQSHFATLTAPAPEPAAEATYTVRGEDGATGKPRKERP